MRIDDLLAASSGVLALRDHPRQARSIQRAAERGLVAAILPGVFVQPEHLCDPAARLRALAAWSPLGSVCAGTAVEFLDQRPISMPVHLRSPNRREPVGWLRVTRSVVPAGHRLRHRGVNTVTPDFACLEVATSDDGSAVFDFLRRGLVTPESLAEALPAFDHTPHNPVRRRIALRALSNPWSFAEARLHDLLETAGITGWVANQPLRLPGGLLFPDVWFRRQRVVLEFDGAAFHTSHADFERDRRHQNLLVAAGFRVVRITWTMLVEDPRLVVGTVRAVLAVS